MKTSVVLAAYNGKKYIIEQLESIRQQTVSVDEVLIVDDRSTDNTVELCQRFIENFSLHNWRVESNSHNLGVVWSFWKAFKRVSGDIVFMADQDDIWMNNKVEVMLSVFESNHSVYSLATTFLRFNEQGIIVKKVNHPYGDRNGLSKISFKEFCLFPFYLGMSCAFRKELLSKVHSDFDGIPHDIFINFYASLNDSFYYLDKVVTRRRSYQESVSNSKAKLIANEYNGSYYLMANSRYKFLYEHFFSYVKKETEMPNSTFGKQLKIAKDYDECMNLRFYYLKKNKIFSYMKNIAYFMNEFGLKNVFRDMLYFCKIKS